MRRLQNTTDSVEASIHAPGAGGIVAAVRRLAAERPGLPRMPKSAVPPVLPPFPANHPDDPRWQQSPIPYSDALATRIPQPLVQFRRAYLCAWSDRMALRKQLAGEIAGLERLLAERRRWSHALPGEDAAVRRAYADWADRCRQVPLPGDRAGLEPVAAADDAERGLRREALWARIGVLRAELRRVLAQDRRADRDIRTFVESMPVLLEDRTRLEPAVLDLDQHARIQRQPGYHAWRTQAQAAIRTGTALLETGTTAELLHAGPGRHARVAGAIALLADMLVLDDRVQALGRHGGDLDRSADRRIRTFVETIPVLLENRTRLEPAVLDLDQRARIQGQPGYHAWRTQAQAAIRTGTALLKTGTTAELLHAEPGRHARVAGAVALLADTLVLDDRAHALARHGENLDRSADRRIRAFVLETIPAVLADRARLEHTAGDRAWMASIQEEPDDAAWRQRADPVIRTGTALLHSKRMAALLDAVPGRRAGITNAVALLADTLVLDDRVQALGRHGGDLDRHADRRVRTFVLETIPAVLADRARLERTAGDRAGMAGIQEEPDYAAWRQRADPVVRTGTALLDSKRMAALLDAEPDRRAVIGSAAACLRDTLDLDDRAHTLLLRYRDGIHPTDAADAGPTPATAPLLPVPTTLRELVETAEGLWIRHPGMPAPAPTRLAPGPASPDGAGPVPAALTSGPSRMLPPPIAAMVRDAGARRARRLAKLLAENLPRLQALVDRREEIRRAAVAASADVSADPEHDQWRTDATDAVRQARLRLGTPEPWLAAYHPASPAAETAWQDTAAAATTLEGARARDAIAAGCVADLRRHAQDAVSEGQPPYAGPAYAALAGRIRGCRESALPGECPPLLAAVAERPGALQDGHVRVWHQGTCVLPDLDGRLRTRAELCAVAQTQGSSVTEMPGYGDWDRQAEEAARAVPGGSASEDPWSAWHWHIVHRSPQGARARDRLAAATREVARAARIDREARALLADPLRPTDQAQSPWAEPTRAAEVPRYEDYVERIRTLHTDADRPGEMPPSLLRTAQAFETWMRDRAVVTEHVATIRSGLRRSRQLLAEAGDSNAPFRDDRGADYQNWLGELRRIKRAATALQRDLPRYRAHMRAIGFRDREWGARRRIAGLLPHLDRTPAGRLLQLHDAIANAPASAPVWLGSAAAGSVVRAWQDMARNNDPTGAGTGARTPPAPIRHLEEGRALHEHAGRIRFLAEHYRDMGAGHWLWDPMDSTWPDQVDRNITAAGNFLGDPGTLERLEQHFPDSTAALSKDLAIVSAAFAAHQERQRERSRTTQETPSRGSPGPPQTGAWSAGPTSGIDGSRSAPTDRRPRPARPPAPGASSRRGGGLDR